MVAAVSRSSPPLEVDFDRSHQRLQQESLVTRIRLNMATDNLENEKTQYVILRRYRDLPEAVVVKSILDFEGIECFLSDENLIRMDWFWSGMLGGVKLWVKQQDFDEAQKLIDQTSPEGFNVEGVGEFNQPHCPKCQSVDVSFKESGLHAWRNPVGHIAVGVRQATWPDLR